MPKDKNKSIYFDDYKSHSYLDEEKDFPVEINAIYYMDDGLTLHICYGHDNEPFEDENGIKISLLDIVNAAIPWVDNGGEYIPARIQIANHLRYIANHIEAEQKAIIKKGIK